MNAKKPNTNFFILLSLVLLNTIIKGIFITNTDIAGDEPFSIFHAQLDIVAIIQELSQGNNPPLYEMFLHFWIKIFGISALAVRVPSLIFSSLTVLFLYKLATKHLNYKVAILASILFIFSNYQIVHAHEARVYTLFGLLTTVSMFYYLELITTVKSRIKKGHLIAFILTNTLLIYAHYFGFFVLFIQAIHLLINPKILRQYWKQILIILSIIALLYLPNIIVVISRFINSVGGTSWLKSPNGLAGLYNKLNAFNNAPLVNVVAIIIIVAGLVKHFILNKLNRVEPVKQLIIIWFVFPFFFMFFISYWVPIFHGRYLMFLSIGYYLTLAIAAEYLIKTTKFKYVIPFVIGVLYIATTKPNIPNKRNVKATIQKINTLKTDKTVLYFCPDWFAPTFAYHYNIDYFNINKSKSTEEINQHLNHDNIYPIADSSQLDLAIINQANKLIYLDAGANFGIPNNNILNKLNNDYTLLNKYEFYEIFVIYEFQIRKNEE